MYQTCHVIENQQLCEGFLRLRLEVGEMAAAMRPGQFVMLKCWDGDEPFFMRPFSINMADKKNQTLDLLYKLVGQGTKKMEKLQAGDCATIMGPLGHGFPLHPNHKTIAILGRGIGAAPMRFLARQAVDQGMAVHVFLSASRREYLFDLEDYRKMGAEVYSSWDNRQDISQKLCRLLPIIEPDAIYTCGSKRFIHTLQQIRQSTGLPCYASLEEHMACGVGACKGCTCSLQDQAGKQTMAQVCHDGPVFPAERIVL